MRNINLPKTATITDIRLTRALRRAGPLSQAALAALAYDLYHGWAHTCPDVLINGEPSDINVPWGHACRYCGAQPAGFDAAREG